MEYGADLEAGVLGSGFACSRDASRAFRSVPGYSSDEEISKSPWNLNNLPVSKYSLLRHIEMDISGMKIPWLYAGMLFSCFCWHTEDHWSYSMFVFSFYYYEPGYKNIFYAFSYRLAVFSVIHFELAC